jgi:hypothetical protein
MHLKSMITIKSNKFHALAGSGSRCRVQQPRSVALWVSNRRVSNKVKIKVFYAARMKRQLEAGLTRLAQACEEDDEASKHLRKLMPPE